MDSADCWTLRFQQKANKGKMVGCLIISHDVTQTAQDRNPEMDLGHLGLYVEQLNQKLLISWPILLRLLRSFDHRFLWPEEPRKQLQNQNAQPYSHSARIFWSNRIGNCWYLNQSCSHFYIVSTIVFYDPKNLGNDSEIKTHNRVLIWHSYFDLTEPKIVDISTNLVRAPTRLSPSFSTTWRT